MPIHYPVTCRFCGTEFDSEDSVADSMDMLRTHIEFRHPTHAED